MTVGADADRTSQYLNSFCQSLRITRAVDGEPGEQIRQIREGRHQIGIVGGDGTGDRPQEIGVA